MKLMAYGLGLLLGISGVVHAQPHNGEVYRQLMRGFFDEQGNQFLQVNGSPVEAYTPPYVLDSTTSRQLIVSQASVSYERLGPKRYLRQLSLRLTLQDSSLQAFPLTYTDTLSKSQLKQAFRASPYALQGDMPTPEARWILPAALITASVGGFISLFFLRSR